MCKQLGIDISVYQGDFPLDIAVSEGVKFVIIKAGGGDAGFYKDDKFERNYDFAKRIKLPVGCYFYSKALDEYSAIQEADFLYNNCLKGKSFELPVYYDVENSYQLSLGKEKVTNIIKSFCDYINNKGYKAGIYSSLSSFRDCFIDEKLSQYEHWVAQWSSKLSYTGKCAMWQFGGEVNYIRSNKIAGQIVDQDYMLYDITNKDKNEDSSKKKLTINEAIDLVVDTALNEVNYHEKASNYMLDDKTANSGSANYTKYARDLDNIKGFYNGLKQGYPYCDVFVDWDFVKCFGAEIAMKMLYQPEFSAGAGCTYSMQYYKNNNAFTTVPKKGYQIFFGNSYESTHTGIVIDVDDDIVFTVEGNTSDGVYKKSYSIYSDNILGYGIPNYNLVCEVDLDYSQNINHQEIYNSDRISSIKDVQKFLNKNYIGLFQNKLDEDNIYGALTKEALTMAIQDEIRVSVNGTFSIEDKKHFPVLKNGSKGIIVKLVQCALICNGLFIGNDGADGDYGSKTSNAVIQFQRVKMLDMDGECGPETAYKLFN